MNSSNESQKVLVHIGYHKTGTSYLQAEFFTKANGFQRWPDRQRDLHPVLVNLGPYDPVPNATIELLKQAEEAARYAGHQFVVSHERLSGHPSSGGYDSAQLASRLKQLFPNGRILIVIREQETMIRSAYSQFVTEGGSLSLRKFLTDPQPDVRKVPTFSLKHFEFAPAIRHYQNLFGPENVLALPYEHFAADPVSFLNRLGKFARPENWKDLTQDQYRAVRINRSRKVLVQTAHRFLNAWIVRTQLSNSGLFQLPKLVRLYEKTTARTEWLIPQMLDGKMVERQKRLIRSIVGDYYVAHNREVAKLIDFDLVKFGYR